MIAFTRIPRHLLHPSVKKARQDMADWYRRTRRQGPAGRKWAAYIWDKEKELIRKISDDIMNGPTGTYKGEGIRGLIK